MYNHWVEIAKDLQADTQRAAILITKHFAFIKGVKHGKRVYHP